MADEVRVACKVMSERRADGREVFIIIKTEYPAGSSTPGRTYVVGPRGEITDTYEEMLELLGLDTRARPTAAESNDTSQEEELSDEEFRRKMAKDQQTTDALGDFLDFGSGRKRRRPEPGAALQPPVQSAAAANVDRAELERGFADRFPSLRGRNRRGDPQDVAYRTWSVRHILRIENCECRISSV